MLIELKNGKRKDFKPAIAKVLIARGVGKEVEAGLQYQTRMMSAAPPSTYKDWDNNLEANTVPNPAPYGYKADGTPRKRPGRAAKVDE